MELSIYDTNHKLVRHVSSEKDSDHDSEREREENHASLPIAERWFPVPQHLETEPGMHRFIWNLAWGTSGVAESDDPDDGEGSIPRGPRVAPGSYTLELEVDGKKVAPEALVVVMDPRSPASPTILQQQFEASYKIFQASLESRRALAEIGSVQEQLAKIATHPALQKQTADLAGSIRTLLDGDPHSADRAIGLEQANTELTSALNAAESFDRPTPAQVLEVYAEAHTASTARVHEWAALKKGSLAELNRQLKSQNKEPIAIGEIEHEVYYLMTR